MRRTARGSAEAADDFPRVASGVTIEPPATDGAVTIVAVSGVPASRVSPQVGRLLAAMDGQTSVRELKAEFAPASDDEEFGALLTRFRHSGLLVGSERRPAGRVTYRPPLTVQFATLHAPAVFAAIDRLLGRAVGRWLATPVLTLVIAGVVAMAAQWDELWNQLISPMPLMTLLVVALAMTAATLAHEVAHGATLMRFGQAPRRAGFMLLYLSPAFFVDVTSGWRLPRRQSRVAVALAGPAVHAALGGACFVAAWPADAATGSVLLVLGAACYTVVVINLIPFVRFDGYLALMSWLDEPGLRARSMADARQSLSRLLFGGPVAPRRLTRWWSVPFGILSHVVPTVLVAYALVRMTRVLAGAGPFGAGLQVGMGVVVGVVALLLVGRGLARVWRRGGINPLRFLVVIAGAIALVVAAGATVRIPIAVQGGFVSRATGIEVVVADAESASAAPDGARVELLTNGLFANAPLADRVLTREAPRNTTAPLSTLFPVEAAGAAVPAVRVGGVEVEEPRRRGIPHAGLARIVVGSENLWEHAWRALVVEPARTLLNIE